MDALSGQSPDVVQLHAIDGLDPECLCENCEHARRDHIQIDTPEGPDYRCPTAADITDIAELERRAELRRQEEVAAILARMDAMDGPSKVPQPAKPEPYRPAASTVDAFWYVVGLRNPERIKAWLHARPEDAPFLLKLLEG
jgi:hypothetical protein